MAKKTGSRAARKGTPRRHGKAQFPASIDKDEYTYRAAELLCEGYTAASIARKLFKDQYEKTPEYAIMWTKRLIQAGRRKYISLNSQIEKELSENQLTLRNVKATVVNDGGLRGWQTTICRAAALEIADRIYNLLASSKPSSKTLQREKTAGNPRASDTIRIANAGGPTIHKIVEYLEAVAHIPATEVDRNRLEFISLNAAGKAHAYHLSANFLAVRMAEIYDVARHRTVLPGQTKEIDSYDSNGYDLVICGAGTRVSFFTNFLERHRWTIPENFVGDIAFVPVDEYGEEVQFDEELKELIEKELMPMLSYEDLVNLAQKGKLLLAIPHHPDSSDLERDERIPAEELPSKKQVYDAICRKPLASQEVVSCVIGKSLIG